MLIEHGGSGVNIGAGKHGPHVWVLMVGGWAHLVIIGGLSVVGSDGMHWSMCVDGGGGRCRLSMVVVGLTSELVNA